ncbi:MarR family winged helix-turn-helix transcriptional regulator [Winogradskya humida]|uniref:HTH marR-type domain-containing protein n=1 Tax=Winogradskya humida TaxID=113566 RepID=A0ABQ3ZZ95_9ACTN|nr:MarR family winged helix-turn-helix transcriptional regulator [Actinoplanes humidus]GIE23907.1 hypothetical protein Ahu01nite_070090 [Actinoplanes humidus]
MAVQGEHTDSLFEPGRRSRLLQLLRTYTDTHVELTRHLARTLGIHANDAVAIAEILWAEATGDPLSPVRLSERIGLASGGTATLLNRLETAGFVVRSREDTDRRIVRLRLTPQARSRTEDFFLPTGEHLNNTLDGYDDATLEHMEHLLTEIVAVTAARNEQLRADLKPASSGRQGT